MSAPLSQKQFRLTSDPTLKGLADAGDPLAHEEATRRGGLDYLNFPRSEWTKSPKDRDESKRI